MAPNIEQQSSDSLKLQYLRNVAIMRTVTAVTAPVCAKRTMLAHVPESDQHESLLSLEGGTKFSMLHLKNDPPERFGKAGDVITISRDVAVDLIGSGWAEKVS